MSDCELETSILKQYEIQKRLGKGAYGIVWRAKNKRNGAIVAVKKIFDAFRNQTDAQRTFREITYLQEFAGHPNIIRLLNVIKANNNKDIYLVFEHMESDLHNCIKKGNILKDVHKKYIFYQVLRAVKFIHSANVIHRDLKPSNVLLDSDCLVKVCDFGLTRSLSAISNATRSSVESFTDAPMDTGDPELTEYVATRWYRAPEILLASSRYTKFVDMWSLGCILGEMLSGKPIFPGTSTINQIERIISVVDKPSVQDISNLHSEYGRSILDQALQKPRGSLEALFPPDVDQDALDLVKKLLVLNPVKRLTVEQALNHPYVRKFRDPASEVVMDHTVTPSLSDDHQLSVSDYREKLYEIILEKKAQRRIRRMLRSMELDAGHASPEYSPSEDRTINQPPATTNGHSPQKQVLVDSKWHNLHTTNDTNSSDLINDELKLIQGSTVHRNFQNDAYHGLGFDQNRAHRTWNPDTYKQGNENLQKQKRLSQYILNEPEIKGIDHSKPPPGTVSQYASTNCVRAPKTTNHSFSVRLENPMILRTQLRTNSGVRDRRQKPCSFMPSEGSQPTGSAGLHVDGQRTFIGRPTAGSYTQTYGTVSRSQLTQIQSRQWTR